jgi:hypothetical protein
LRDVRLRNIRGRAENSFRIDGQPDQPVEDVLLEKIDLTIDKWTQYPGGKFDNRPTMAGAEGLEPHKTPVFFLRNARRVTVRDCQAHWGVHRQPYFGSALEADHVADLKIERFQGEAADPKSDKAIAIR